MAELGNILIVGGGIAGLTLAAALERQGFRAELVERDPGWRALGAGIAVQPNGMRVLRRLGMDGAVEAAGIPLRRWVFADQRGEMLSETDLGALWGDVGPFVGIARTPLQRVLQRGAGVVPSPPSVQMWLGEGCFFGLCPVGDGSTYGFGNVTSPREHDPVKGRLERLRKRFAEFGTVVRDYLASLESDEQVHCSPIEWVEVERWHAGRVVLIGHAAHASSPMMGQGGCLAIEDAWVLAEVLRAEPTVERALEVWAERRRPRVTWVHQQSRAIGESFRLPPRVRDGFLRERGAEMLRQRFAPLLEPP